LVLEVVKIFMSEHIYLIDLDRVIHDKMGKKARFVPRFLLSYLKKIIHQDELNVFLKGEGEKQGVPWLWDCVRFLDMNLNVVGRENLPPVTEAGHYTFVSNHPLGGQDGVALGAVLGEYFEGHVKYLVNDLLMNLHGLAPLCIPINKTGSQSRSFPAMVEAGFHSDDAIIMFPAGLCSRKNKGKVRDLTWQKTFVTKSVETHRDVIPIHFSGSNSERFYRLANICKALHLKVNIAMLYLVDEMMKNRHKTFTITIGKPIPWQTFDKTRKPVEWAEYVQNVVYNLNRETTF